LEVKGGSVPNFIIDIFKAAIEKDPNAGTKGLDCNGEAGECGDGRGSNRGMLQNDSIVNEANVLGRVLRDGWTVSSKEMQNAHCEFIVLAVFNELAQLGEGCGVACKVSK
jgi:hypothetical protein